MKKCKEQGDMLRAAESYLKFFFLLPLCVSGHAPARIIVLVSNTKPHFVSILLLRKFQMQKSKVGVTFLFGDSYEVRASDESHIEVLASSWSSWAHSNMMARALILHHPHPKLDVLIWTNKMRAMEMKMSKTGRGGSELDANHDFTLEQNILNTVIIDRLQKVLHFGHTHKG